MSAHDCARFQRIEERLATACQKAGRSTGSVRLISVCKKQSPEHVLRVIRCGAIDLGENTLQGLQATDAALHAELSVDTLEPQSTLLGKSWRWHFVGRLQRRKVRPLLAYRPLIHSVDSLPLAEEISRRALMQKEALRHMVSPAQQWSPIEVLVQVNTGKEPQKGGIAPTHASDFTAEVAALPGITLRGLMVVPPAGAPGAPHFEMLAKLLQTLQECPEADLLSMGMSQDFEEAIACGASMVRVGTAIFGSRA